MRFRHLCKKSIPAIVTCLCLLLLQGCAKKPNSQDDTKVLMTEDLTQVSEQEPSQPDQSKVTATAVFEVDNSEAVKNEDFSGEIKDYYATAAGDPSGLCVIDSDGTLWLSGDEIIGRMAQGEANGRTASEPVRVAENVVHVDYSQEGYFIYLTAGNELYGFGTYVTGALLEDMEQITFDSTILPEAEKYIVSTPKLLMSEVVFAKCGRGDVIALKQDRTLWTWGTVWNRGKTVDWSEGKGTVKNNGILDQEPVQILEDVIYITGGWFNHAALKDDGTVWTWGYNYAGNCGIDPEKTPFIDRPVKAAEEASMVWTGTLEQDIDVTHADDFHGEYKRQLENTFLRKKDGTLWVCGINVGDKKVTLEAYGEIGGPYTITASYEFQPCEIKEK